MWRTVRREGAWLVPGLTANLLSVRAGKSLGCRAPDFDALVLYGPSGERWAMVDTAPDYVLETRLVSDAVEYVKGLKSAAVEYVKGIKSAIEESSAMPAVIARGRKRRVGGERGAHGTHALEHDVGIGARVEVCVPRHAGGVVRGKIRRWRERGLALDAAREWIVQGLGTLAPARLGRPRLLRSLLVSLVVGQFVHDMLEVVLIEFPATLFVLLRLFAARRVGDVGEAKVSKATDRFFLLFLLFSLVVKHARFVGLWHGNRKKTQSGAGRYHKHPPNMGPLDR